MNEIKLGTNLELTVSELVEEYSQLLTNEIVTSFQKQGRFTGNTKKSVIKALENKFESVEYVAGAGKRKAKFILTNYNGNVEDYNAYKNNGGSIAYDWTEVDNMIRNQLSKYSNDEHYHSTSSIIHNSLKIEYISDAVSNFYDHLTGFKTLENGEAKYNIKNLQEIFEWFERYQLENLKNRVRYILSNDKFDFKERYMALQTSGNPVIISSKKYQAIQEYKAKETKFLRALSGNAKMNISRAISKDIENKFGYVNVYTTFSFIDIEKFENDDFDLQKIKLELLERWNKQALKKERKQLQKEPSISELFSLHESFYKKLFTNKEYSKLMNTFVKLHILG